MIPEGITDSFTRLTGYTAAELQVREAQQRFRLYHPSSEAEIASDMSRLLHGETVHNEYQIVTKTGELRWLHLYRQPVWNAEEQRVAGYYAAAQDVTARKLGEQALQQYATRLEILRQIDQAILSAASPLEIAEAVVRFIRQLIPCDQTDIDVFDFTTNERIRLATVQDVGQPEVPGSRHALDMQWVEPLRQDAIHVVGDLALESDPLPVMQRILRRGYHNIVRVSLVIRAAL